MVKKAFIALLALVVVLGVAGFILLRSFGRSLDYQHAMSLQRQLVSFAVDHNKRLPNSWDEFTRFQGSNTDWSFEELQKLGTLRWSWVISELPPDRKYVYVSDIRYRRFESFMNEEILKQMRLR